MISGGQMICWSGRRADKSHWHFVILKIQKAKRTNLRESSGGVTPVNAQLFGPTPPAMSASDLLVLPKMLTFLHPHFLDCPIAQLLTQLQLYVSLRPSIANSIDNNAQHLRIVSSFPHQHRHP